MKISVINVKEILKSVGVYAFYAICSILVIACFICLINACTGPWFYTDDTIAYKVVSDECRTYVSVENVIKEKGKEDMYRLSFSDTRLPDHIEIPASIYNEYIGEGNNAITYKSEEINLYVADFLLGASFDSSDIYSVYRYSLPWENQDISFSEDNINEFKNLLVKDKKHINTEDLSFDFYSCGNGYSRYNCINNGAQKFSEKT